ncbi:LCP family protein [Streptomyces coffeae]|uniref:LCP family protein n=1 Tax=Streptomyces coffeae TaxID=621382 RepID=A0ABS1NRQ6_9ACTN|nr:LCP family protein [Streptomyces coffeae]MBL1102781.1 LCP family protein [Streptomyces coffeae]
MNSARFRAARSPKHRSRCVRTTLWVAVAGLAAVSVGGGLLYTKLGTSHATADVEKALGSDRPARTVNGALNVLVLGSDSRAGKNRKYGKDQGSARSDTALLVHLARGRSKATVISIPRDTLVDRPSCPLPDGGDSPADDSVMFNTAYEVGGLICATKTVERLGNIRIEHVLDVDFDGFKSVVTAVGGIRITLDKPLHDKYSHLDLDIGPQRLNGEQALALVRTRHGIGDGSDLGRIRLQQRFMTAFATEFKNSSLLTDPVKLYGVADAVSGAITTDKGLDSPRALFGLARSLSGLKPTDVDFRTLPVAPSPADPNRVVVKQTDAALLWQAIRNDTPPPAPEKRAQHG